jgi:hypothetical protein
MKIKTNTKNWRWNYFEFTIVGSELRCLRLKTGLEFPKPGRKPQLGTNHGEVLSKIRHSI